METRSDFKPRHWFQLMSQSRDRSTQKIVREFTLEVATMYNEYSCRRHIWLSTLVFEACVIDYLPGQGVESLTRCNDELRPNRWAGSTYWELEELVEALTNLPGKYPHFKGLDRAVQEAICNLF